MDALDRLEATIRTRRGADPTTSYVASLFARGRPRIAQKLGEEAVETVIAAMGDRAEAIVPEAADLLFHLLVLLADADLSIDDVRTEHDRREGVSGHAERASRPAPATIAAPVSAPEMTSLSLAGMAADEGTATGQGDALPLPRGGPIVSQN